MKKIFICLVVLAGCFPSTTEIEVDGGSKQFHTDCVTLNVNSDRCIKVMQDICPGGIVVDQVTKFGFLYHCKAK